MRLRFGIVPEQPYTRHVKEILGTVKTTESKHFTAHRKRCGKYRKFTARSAGSRAKYRDAHVSISWDFVRRMFLRCRSERTGGFAWVWGNFFNITRERIRQIEAKSLPRMLLASRRPKQAEVLARLRKLVEEGPSIGTAHKIESKKEAPETLKIKTAIAGLAAYAKYSDRKIALLLTAQTEEFHKAQDIRAMREQLPDLTGYQETQSAESFQKFISSFSNPK